MLRKCFAMLCCCVALKCNGQIAAREGSYDRKNTWTVLADYSNTSSRFVAGRARQRELVTLGGAYTRRVVRFRGTELGYRIELRPVVFESDPVNVTTITFTGPQANVYTDTTAVTDVCHPFSVTSTEPGPPGAAQESVTYSSVCGRQWTFGQSFSPFGVHYVLGYRHRVQPYLVGTLGYMYTSRPVPVADAEAFNFVIDAGAGVEVFRSGTRSLALEARAHHFSNRNTAKANPGVDNVVYGVAYSFGR